MRSCRKPGVSADAAQDEPKPGRRSTAVPAPRLDHLSENSNCGVPGSVFGDHNAGLVIEVIAARQPDAKQLLGGLRDLRIQRARLQITPLTADRR